MTEKDLMISPSAVSPVAGGTPEVTSAQKSCTAWKFEQWNFGAIPLSRSGHEYQKKCPGSSGSFVVITEPTTQASTAEALL
jgi:hypothetical protein